MCESASPLAGEGGTRSALALWEGEGNFYFFSVYKQWIFAKIWYHNTVIP